MSDISIATLQARAMQAELERDQARAELADCQRQAAAYRAVLLQFIGWYERPTEDQSARLAPLVKSVYEALKADAGRGWVKSDELDALAADNRKLRELLRNFEWVRYNLATGIKGCRICGGDFPHHRPDCALDAALKEGK